MERLGGHDSASSGSRGPGGKSGGGAGGSGGRGGAGDDGAPRSHHHHHHRQNQRLQVHNQQQDSPGLRGGAPKSTDRQTAAKMTPASPLASLGAGGKGSGEGPGISLKDAVLAASRAHHAQPQDSPAARTNVRKEKDKSQQNRETRSQSEGPATRKTAKSSQSERSSSQDSKSAKGQAASDDGTESRSKTTPATARKKNARPTDLQNNSKSPGRLKKSLSTDWDAGSSSTNLPHATARTKDANSPHKTPPRIKRKLSRGHTVHDVNEYGEVLDRNSEKDGGRTSKKTSPKGDVSLEVLTPPKAQPEPSYSPKSDLRAGGRKKDSNHLSKRTPDEAILPDVTIKPGLSLSKHLPTSLIPSARQSPLQAHLLPELTQQSFFSLNKVPSRSSTSSDVQSEVCVDLPDYTELPAIHDVHSTDRDRDHQDLQVKLGFPVAPFERLRPVGRERYPCLSLLGSLLVLLVSLVLFVPVLLLVLFLVPLCLAVKCVFSLCCCCGRLWGKCCISCCYTHLTSSEQLWIQKDEGGGSTGGRLSPVAQSIIVLQRGLSTERLRHLLDSRLLSLENRHGRRVYPRFTQRVVSFCCGYSWVPDDNFFINNHVFNMPGYIESLEDLQDYVAKMASEPLSLDHPLWEVQVLHNFREPRDTVLLFRMHLAMADGATMVRILEHAIVDSQKVSQPKGGFGVEAANMSPLKAFFMGPVTFCSRYLFRRSDFNLFHGRHVHPCGEMAVAWSEPFSLSAAVRVKQVARCTLSELLISVVAGNMRTYMQVSGIPHPYNIHCALPVDFRSDCPSGATTVSGTGSNPVSVTEVGNHYSMAVLPLATNTEGAIPRLWETKLRLEKFKSSPEAAIVSGAQWFTCCVLPVAAFQRLWQKIYSRCTCLVANLAGPESSLKLDSREIKCMLYWVPPLERVAITISFLTYADQVRMAVISDRAVLPNPELLTRDFIYKLETMSKLLAHRRIPGEQLSSRMESMHMLSSYTLDDLTSEQLQLQMTLVQQELHDMKLQLESGSAHRLTHNDTQLCQRIEQLKERSRELLMHLRKRRAAEAENAVILSEEDELLDSDSDRGQRPFRRRTLSMSSKMSTTSVSSTMRPLSTASLSNHPSPSHAFPPPWPDNGTPQDSSDRPFSFAAEATAGGSSGPGSKKHGYNYRQRLSTMEEYEMDESLIVAAADPRKCNTY